MPWCFTEELDALRSVVASLNRQRGRNRERELRIQYRAVTLLIVVA